MTPVLDLAPVLVLIPSTLLLRTNLRNLTDVELMFHLKEELRTSSNQQKKPKSTTVKTHFPLHAGGSTAHNNLHHAKKIRGV